MSCTPPSRSSASPGTNEARESSSIPVAMPVARRSPAMIATRRTIVRSGRAGLVATAWGLSFVMPRRPRRLGGVRRELLGALVRVSGLIGAGRAGVRPGFGGIRGFVTGGQGRGVVRDRQVEIFRAFRDDLERRVGDAGDEIAGGHDLRAGGRLDGDDLTVDVHYFAVYAAVGDDLDAHFDTRPHVSDGLPFLPVGPRHQEHEEAEDGNDEDEFHGYLPGGMRKVGCESK